MWKHWLVEKVAVKFIAVQIREIPVTLAMPYYMMKTNANTNI